MKDKITTLAMEIAVAEYFGTRANLIVPNVSWGLEIHECDLLVLTPAGYAYEIEIKISRADIIKDKEKSHGHDSEKIKYLYFAIPEKLLSCVEYIPERAGILSVFYRGDDATALCGRIRTPKSHNNYQFSLSERCDMARLGTMRMWNLKRKLLNE